MSHTYAIVEMGSGRIIGRQSRPVLAANQFAMTLLDDAGQDDMEERLWVAHGAFVERPTLPAIPSGPAPLTLDFGGCPEGTRLMITNEGEDFMTADVGETIVLEQPGTYRIDLFPPFPHRDSIQWLQVD